MSGILLLELRKQSIQFMYNIFAKDCIEDKKLNFESDYFNDVINECFEELIKNKQPLNNPFLIKLGGQSGSGKTLQLLPAIVENIKTDNYVHLAVRLFAKKHPYYNELIEKYGEGLIREKTNGFALMCLFALTEKLIQNKYNVFCEITLLDPVFEEYFARLAKMQNYKIIYNVLTVPLEISNSWIQNRLQNSNYEKNRIVSQNSIDFFYNILPQAILKILEISDIFDENDYFVLWNIFEKTPLIVSNKFEKNIFDIFNKNRIYKNTTDKDIPEVDINLQHKTNFYKNFFNNIFRI